MTLPLVYVGDGNFQASSTYHTRRCEERYGLGELVQVEETSDRSPASHKAYFAEINDLWETLSETLAGDFPSTEHLRKYALIKAGYCTQAKMTLPTKEEAIEAAAFIKSLDGYAIAEPIGRILTVWRANSQSMKAMKRDEFEKSKSDVLDVIRKLVGK